MNPAGVRCDGGASVDVGDDAAGPGSEENVKGEEAEGAVEVENAPKVKIVGDNGGAPVGVGTARSGWDPANTGRLLVCGCIDKAGDAELGDAVASLALFKFALSEERSKGEEAEVAVALASNVAIAGDDGAGPKSEENVKGEETELEVELAPKVKIVDDDGDALVDVADAVAAPKNGAAKFTEGA